MMINFSRHYKWFLTISEGFKLRMFAFFTLEILSIIFTLSFIFYSKKTIDIALNVINGDLQFNLAIVVFCALMGVLTKSLSQWINQKTQIKMTLDFQYTVLKTQMLSVWKVIKRWDTGDLLVRINSDCTEIVQMISQTWITLIITVIKILMSFIFLYSMDSMLAIIILCVTPLFLLTKIYFNKMRALNAKVKKSESEVGSAMQENLRYRTVLRALGILNNRLIFFKNIQKNFVNLRLEYLNFTLVSNTLMRFGISIGYLVAFSWGIYRLKNNEITFGTMTAFLQLVNQIQSPILALAVFFPAFVRYKVSSDRIQELLSVEIDPLKKGVEIKNVNKVIFKEVSFKYKDDLILNKLNTSFNKGEITAIIGASGKGKTTLIRLLLGLLKPENGKIFITNDTENYELETRHIENFSYVPQGNTLLSGTIRSNITLGNDRITDEKLKEVLYISCAEFVFDLPNGLDTIVEESGLGLSEGQAQRIAIARAILRDRNIWLFDEATSAIDYETTKIFLNRIKNLIEDKIVIFVTHDSTVASFSDKQLLMN
jgi:ATP-binding cassette subfamily B protein